MAETEHTEMGRRAARRPLFITLVTLGGVVLCAVPFLGGLRRVIALSPGFTAMGGIWLVAAVGSLAFWGWRVFN